jgi:uncharacterized protein
MGRLIFFLLLALVVYLAIRYLLRSKRPPEAARSAGEPMVHCEHCGLYLPRAEALQAEGRNYCSAEHQRAAGK